MLTSILFLFLWLLAVKQKRARGIILNGWDEREEGS